MVAVPAAGFEEAVDDALAMGARAIVGITAGLGEAGGEALARERALVERVRAAGAMLLGPNCLGVFDASSDLGLASNEFPPGSIGLISQSGNLALELGILAPAVRARLLAGSPRSATRPTSTWPSWSPPTPPTSRTELIAVYAEDFRDGRAFVDAAAAAGKPVRAADRRAQRRQRPGGGVAHRRAGDRPGGGRGRLPRGRGVPGVDARPSMIDLAQALLQPARWPARGWRCSATAAATAPSPATWRRPPGSSCRCCRRSWPAQLAATLPPTAVDRQPGRPRRRRRAGLLLLQPHGRAACSSRARWTAC